MSTLSHTQLTPLRFLERSAEVFPGKVAIVHGDRRTTYRDFAREATRLARALRASGIEAGDRVAYMCPNIPELLIAHFAVPLAGAVLVAINTRLATEEVRYICEHSGAKLLVVDSELRSIVAPLQDELETLREIVTVTDPVAGVDDAGGARPELCRPARAWIRRAAGLVGRRRAGPDHDQLHVGDHGEAQGRRLHPPGRLPEQPRGGHALRAHRRLGLPLDAPDVPLQRLVHGVGGDRHRRPPRLPARGARRPHLAAAGAGEGDAPQRRPHRPHDAGRRGGGSPAGANAGGDHRGRAAEPDHDRPVRRPQCADPARLRADRDLRSVLGVSVAGGLGGSRRRGASPRCCPARVSG